MSAEPDAAARDAGAADVCYEGCRPYSARITLNVVTDIAGQIIKYGHVVDSHRPYLGVSIADTMGSDGVYISGVAPGGPADKAGIVAGNVITAIDGSPTPTTSDLSSASLPYTSSPTSPLGEPSEPTKKKCSKCPSVISETGKPCA